MARPIKPINAVVCQVAPDGSPVMEHPLPDRDWAVRHVLQYGPDAEVLEREVVLEAILGRLEHLIS